MNNLKNSAVDLENDLSNIKEDLQQAKKEINSLTNDVNEKEKALETIKKEINESSEANKVLVAELATCKEELLKLSSQSTVPQEILKKKDEDYEIIKKMVIDRDNVIKKLEESHKKEVDDLKLQKRGSDDALNIATQENTKLKDKEATLVDIFKYMKKYLAEQDDYFQCDECDQSFDRVDKLNLHKRGKHLALSLKCNLCNFQAKTSRDLINHMKTHSSSRQIFSCEECEYADQLEENLLNHKIAKHSVHKCDKCDYTFSSVKELDEHKQNTHKQQVFSCEKCNFKDRKEENLLNHIISMHTTYTCELCDLKFKVEQDLEDHIQEIHRVSKLSCNICKQTFTALGNLKEHKKKKHEVQTFPCDYCGHKAESLNKLDEHIASFHKIMKRGKGNVVSKFNNPPCDFKNPSHSSICCDRDQGPPMKIYTPEQRIENGPCKHWNESFCRFSDLCKYAHIEPCRFQERCFSPFECNFFHFNRSNAPFLGGKFYRSQSFKFNPEDFPPLPKRS